MKYSIIEIAEILGVDPSHLTNTSIDTLLTDSRTLTYPDRSLFFAIHTDSNDGHRYVHQLYEKGVRNFVVEKIPEGVPTSDANFLVVGNTTKALQTLAAFHRHRFNIPVIGITGSRGKTQVKEWLYQLLRDDYNIVRSPRSYNSQIGVPLSVWDIDDNSGLAIIEAGISQPDEMPSLEKIISPTITVMTNIGSEHKEGFASIEEKCIEKLRLSRHSEYVVFDGDDNTICNGIVDLGYGRQELSWSRVNTDAPIFISSVIKEKGFTTIKFTYLLYAGEVKIPFTAAADIDNAIVCLATLCCLRVPVKTMAERFLRLSPTGTRMDAMEGVNDCQLIYDTYTSDYLSLTPAIDFMSRRDTLLRTRTLILSDVLPENVPAAEVYNRISELIHLRHIDRFIGIGPELTAHRALFAHNSRFFPSTDAFLEAMSPSDFAKELILLKGAPDFEFARIIEMLEARQHETVLEVNLDALVHNFNFYRSRLDPDTGIVCMLKAFGYGAGSYELAKTLQQQGASYIAVAAHDEGVALREAGITMPIMVLNPKVVNYKSLFDNRLEPEVFSFEMCREIIHEAKKFHMESYPIHIKIDTGMHRLGFLYDELPRLIEMLKAQTYVRPVSIFSHLCTADDLTNDDYAHFQLEYFDRCCDVFLPAFDHKVMRHILNTDGILRFADHQYEMVRLGIGLYGVPTLGKGYDDKLRPVSALHSVIIQIRDWEPGTTVGYGRHGVLRRQSRIATIPIGYADGFNRHLGCGKGEVWINGKRVPTVGNICMDLFMADVTDVDCAVGDKVEIFGEHISAQEIADRLDTIPYEVLTSVSSRVKRIYYSE